jgi:hypothetical protein
MSKYRGFNYANLKGEKTGLDAVKFLINYCSKNNKRLPKYYSQSMNPIGRQNILQLLNKYKEKEKNGT